MLLFHGTTESALDAILKHGLLPPQPQNADHDWTWELSGRAQRSAVFLSTAPVAGKGGDPVSFAMGWPLKNAHGSHPGYLVVVDLPPEALHLVHALVPNIELNNFISVSRTRQFLAYTYRLNASLPTNTARPSVAQWTLSHWCLHYWLARYCADHKIALTPAALGEHVPLQISGIDPALPPDLTPLRWQAFLDDYFHLVDFSYMDIDSESERERRRQAVLRRHDITLPNDIEEDWHAKHCRLCMRGLANFAHHFDGFNDYPPFRAFLKAQPKKSSYQRLPEAAHIGTYVMDAPLPSGGLGTVESLASRLRLVRAHAAPFSDEAVETFFHTQENSEKSLRNTAWSWEQWYARFPAEHCTLPHVWHPGYGQQFDAADLKQPDRQVICAPIPPQYLLGAIKISDGARFVPQVRPNRRRGETLSAKLWTLTHALRAQYTGKPIVLD